MAGKFGNMFNKAKNRADNGKDYDIMNPSASNANSKNAKRSGAKALGKALKQVGKAIYKIGKAIVQALLKLGPYGWLALAIIILIIFIAVIIASYNMMPGMMKEKLADLFKINVDGWFSNGAVGSLADDYSDIVDVANYLEEMDYNLIGNGFVRPSLRQDSDMMTLEEIINLHPEYIYKADSDGKFHFYDEAGNIISDLKYYDSIGQTIDNSTGEATSNSEYTDEFGIIRSTEKAEDADVDDRGKVLNVVKADLKNYRLLRTYLLSNYRIYTLKNADEDVLNDIASAFKSLGVNHDSWAKGLIKLYNAKGGIAEGHWWWGKKLLGDMPVINETTLSLKKGWFNNPMNYKIEGWAPRYGMSLDFLISLHLGTNAPDLVYAMLQNFDTEVQVYLDDSGEAKIDARYIDPNDDAHKAPADGDSIEKVKAVLDATDHEIASSVINDGAATEWVNGLALTKKACYALLKSEELTLTSPDNCTGAAQEYVMIDTTNDEEILWDTSPFNSYGIQEEELNELESEFGEYSLTASNGKKIEHFNAKKCAKPFGTDDENLKNDSYRVLKDIAEENGYTLDNSSTVGPTVTNYEETKVVKNVITSPSGYGPVTETGNIYQTDMIKTSTTWTSDVNEEDVEYSWVTYKFLVYKVGEWSRTIPEGSETRTDTEKEWVDTIIWEYIVREKTFTELVESGIIDENGNSLPDESKCSNNPDIKKCCKICQTYVKAAVKAMAVVSDQSYSTYIPYIARVLGSWFRDTYFIVPKEADAAINEYAGGFEPDPRQYDGDGDGVIEDVAKGETEDTIMATNHPEFDIANSYGENAQFVQVDEEYLGDSGEYWTSYLLKDNGDYQLYLLNSDGTTSDIKMEDFLKNGAGQELNGNPVTGYSSKEAAEKDGWAFVKKAVMKNFEGFSSIGIDQSSDELVDKEKLLWSAYGFDTNGSSTNWEKVVRADGNNAVNKLYDIIYGADSDGDEESGIFYQMTKTNNVTQVEDAQRSETNSLVKYLFKYRQFYIYDGGESRGVQIEHDKQRVIYGYNNYVAENYDFENKYYNTKVIADEFDLKDVTFGTENMDGNFYHYKGLLSKNGNTGMLEEYYGSGWKGTVIDLLNNYGRSALRQSYSWSTISLFFDEEEEIVDLAEQWLDWQLDMYYMNKYGVDLKSYYNTDQDLLKITYDPRDPDLVSTIEVTKSSLSVFSILENTGTLDADYAYRDFKELIVELDYFDKEDLSSKIETVFTWVLPDVSACGWPNRPWDKQNVDYGTLIQSHDTYAALGVFDGETGGSFNGDESKIFWIGDSWIVGLRDSGVAKSSTEYFCAVSGSNASDVTVSSNNISINASLGSDSKSVPSDVSAFVVEFGLNNTSGASKTQELLEKLHTTFPNIPIYVLKTSHVATGYPDYAKMNQNIDKYNSEVQSWCSSNSYVTYVENATKTINGGDGLLSDTYKAGSGNGEYHLGAEGNKVWYQDIIAGLSGGATVGSGTPNQSTVSSEFEVKEGDGDCDKIVIANGVEYKQFNQSGKYGSVNVYSGDTHIRTDSGDATLSGMGCGIYSSTSLLSAYVEDVNPKKTCQWLHTNLGTSSFNNDGSRNTSMTEFLKGNGVPGSWYEGDYQNKLKEAFQAGKPVIINIKPGSNTWTTGGGHFICFTGISSDGTVYTADSVAGGGARLKCNLGTDFDSALSSLVSKLVIGCIWIPDTAPTGAKTSAGAGNVYFEGYEADQTVTSPVTGKVLEIGKHDRLNVYTGEMEEVEYIKIKVIDSEDYFDSRIDENTDYGYETETDYELAEALNLFYKEYEDVCAGYTVMIDGFDVDLETDPEGVYEQNEVHALYNSGQMEIRKNREQAKEDAPYFINCGEAEEFPGDEYVTSDSDSIVGYYVKEGKAIGKTIVSDEELIPNPEPNTEPEPSPEPEPNDEESSELSDKLTYTYEDFKDVPGDYMRITVQDTDYALVDDVENFFDIPEPTEEGGLKFNSVSQEYQAQERDLEVLAEVFYHESGGWEAYLSQYNVHGEEEAEFNGYCMGYSVVNKVLEENKSTWYGDLYDSSRTDMSPLVQVVTNQKATWYGDPIPSEAMKVYNGGQGCYSDKDLEFAEFCLTYDCTSVIKPFKTELGSEASSDGYSATKQGTPIPRAMCNQGGYGDGASGQSSLILVGFEDGSKSAQGYARPKNGYFDKGDELWGVDREFESRVAEYIE